MYDLIQNHDGANHQAQAVLAMVRYLIGDGIEASWNDEWKQYDAEPKVTRYDNCREQGYIVFMRSKRRDKQINIAFYEHRNSDQIYVQVVEKNTFNSPVASDIYATMKDKYDCAFSAGCGQIEPVAKFVKNALVEFWSDDDA